jgi:hypothetical protein
VVTRELLFHTRAVREGVQDEILHGGGILGDG